MFLFASVCQEVVWEAFKIFLERLPNQEEYQNWMNQCQTDGVSIGEIGTAFSQSEEHITLVQRVCSIIFINFQKNIIWIYDMNIIL